MDVWEQLTALEPSVSVERWQTALDTPATEDTLEEGTDGYHDHERALEPFPVVSAAPPGKRIKVGPASDVELETMRRVSALLVCANVQGITLSAAKVLSLLR
jgi:hypothetical protein